MKLKDTGLTAEELKDIVKKYMVETYARYDFIAERAEGMYLYDEKGVAYLDFYGGVAVNTPGNRNPKVVAAVKDQLDDIMHTFNYPYTIPQALLAKKICDTIGMDKIFFQNSGTEANECMIKMARKYGVEKYGPEHYHIVTAINGFHGRTYGALSATGQNVYHNFFFPFVEGFVFAKANDTEDAISKLTDDVCAVMMELVQGEGGVMPLEKEYVQAVYAACQEKDILFIVDEVQTGVGRTGTFYSYQQFGIQPDLVSSAKGLGGGLPIGAVLFGEKTQDTLIPGDHGSTFGGNPVVCAGAVEVLNRMDDTFLQNVTAKGRHMREEIEKMPHVTSVAGMGMMLGIELDIDVKPVVTALMENGLLVLTAKHKMRLLPPLNIAQTELEKGLSILKNTLAAL